MAAFYLTVVAVPQVILDNVCLRKHNETMCRAMFIGAFKEEFDVVQKQSTLWVSGWLVVATFVTVLTLPFVGTMSDQFGRYAAMFLSPVSQLIQTLAFIMIIINGLDFPTWALLLVGPIPSLVGDISGLYVLTGSYIADITTEKNRTMRITLLEATGTMAGLLATISSGFIIERFGYMGIFVTDTGLLVLALLYLVFCVKPAKRIKRSKLKETSGAEETGGEKGQKDVAEEETVKERGTEDNRNEGKLEKHDVEIVNIKELDGIEGNVSYLKSQSKESMTGCKLTRNELNGSELASNQVAGSEISGDIWTGNGVNETDQGLNNRETKGENNIVLTHTADNETRMREFVDSKAGNETGGTGNELYGKGNEKDGSDEKSVEEESCEALNTGQLFRNKMIDDIQDNDEILAFEKDHDERESFPIFRETVEYESVIKVCNANEVKEAELGGILPKCEMANNNEEDCKMVSFHAKLCHIFKESNPIRTFVRVRDVLKAEGQISCGLVLFLLMGLTATSYSGELSVLTLFLKNRPYFLSARALGFFFAFGSGIVAILGMVVINYLFTRVIRIDDYLILLIGFCSYIAYFMLLAFAQSLLMLYLIQIIHALGSLCTCIIKSVLSKMVPPSSVGLLFGALLMIETLGVLIGSMVCPIVYSTAAAVWPGAVFFVNVGLMVLALCTAMYLMLRKRNRRQFEVDNIMLEEDAQDSRLLTSTNSSE